MNDYKNSFTVNNPAGEVYAAITQHVQDWWSDDLTGAATNKRDQFNIAFNGTKKTFEIIEVVPNEKVVWLCLKAYIDMETLKKKDDWVGTKVIWTIIGDEQGATLTMEHLGLNKSVECYDVCEPAWNYFMGSIQAFLTTGNGTPFKKAEITLEWENKG